jgi:hypothetical protein
MENTTADSTQNLPNPPAKNSKGKAAEETKSAAPKVKTQ